MKMKDAEICKTCTNSVISDGGFLVGCGSPTPCELLENGEPEMYYSKTGDR